MIGANLLFASHDVIIIFLLPLSSMQNINSRRSVLQSVKLKYSRNEIYVTKNLMTTDRIVFCCYQCFIYEKCKKSAAFQIIVLACGG